MAYSFDSLDYMSPDYTSSFYGSGSYSPDFSSSFMDPNFNWSGITGNSAYDFNNYSPVTDLSRNYQPEATSPSIYEQLGGLRGSVSLGLGGLSLLGSYLANREQNKLGRDQLEAQTGLKERELDTLNNMDLAKTDALMRLVQERQGVQALDPRRYAQVLASGQLPVEDIMARQGVDIGTPQFASGGAMMNYGAEDLYSGNVPMYAEGGPRGALSYLRGESSGQEDDVDAKLSHGEYVFDADVVAALGDGNSEAGARKLDNMREEIRRHKRSASPKKIPPKAKSPMKYLGKR